jgi:hypothetical protein
MKYIYVVLLALVVSGCSAISLLPKSHDPVEAMYLVETRVAVDALSCGADAGWDLAMVNANLLSAYAAYRKEAQFDNAKSIGDNLLKAKNSSVTCNAFLKVAKSRIDILYEAWGSRR